MSKKEGVDSWEYVTTVLMSILGRRFIMEKLLSGRFIFTIIAALVFAWLSITNIMPVDKVYEIILIVVYAYFSRNDRQNKGETK